MDSTTLGHRIGGING